VNVHRALERLEKLTLPQLKHARGLMEIEVTNYKRASANYSPADAKKFAEPFMRGLKENIARIDAEIAKREEQG